MTDISSITKRLPTPEEMYQERAGKPLLKGKSRLQLAEEQRPLTRVDEKAFVKEVRDRDGKVCRWCRRIVVVQMARVANRAECHHLHGRRGSLRFESKCAIQVCASCHEKLTGKVNERWVVRGTAHIEIDGTERIDARQPVRFERVV